jgi:peptidoglycan/xylan/chitin deacetylase (PgdA/CDA1 family)
MTGSKLRLKLSKRPQALHWVLRERLSPTARARLRRLADPLLAPVGSIRNARRAGARLTITFDDGPDPRHTPGILDALARHDVKATFFMLSEAAEAHPELARRVVAEGHEIALHGANHDRLTRLSPAEVEARVRGGRDRLERVVGRPLRWFRPPFGSQSLRTWFQTRRAGLRVVVWTTDLRDWTETKPADVARAGVEAAASGAILLMHDGIGSPDPDNPAPEPKFDRAEAVDQLLTELLARGWKPVTVGELLATAHPVHSAWFRP